MSTLLFSRAQAEQRLLDLAEHFGLMWINVPDAETNPYGEIGHFVRKDGARSGDICILDAGTAEIAKLTIVPEIKRLLSYEAEGSGI